MRVDGVWVKVGCVVEPLRHCKECVDDNGVYAIRRILEHQLNYFLHFRFYFGCSLVICTQVAVSTVMSLTAAEL